MLPILRELGFRPDNTGTIERFFNEFWPKDIQNWSRWGKLDVYEDDNNLYVEAEVPGFKREDIQLTLDDGILQLEAEHKQKTEDKKNRKYYVQERSFEKWSRSIHLPVSVDPSKVDASFKDGVLKITLPKQEQHKTHKIQIK